MRQSCPHFGTKDFLFLLHLCTCAQTIKRTHKHTTSIYTVEKDKTVQEGEHQERRCYPLNLQFLLSNCLQIIVSSSALKIREQSGMVFVLLTMGKLCNLCKTLVRPSSSVQLVNFNSLLSHSRHQRKTTTCKRLLKALVNRFAHEYCPLSLTTSLYLK